MSSSPLFTLHARLTALASVWLVVVWAVAGGGGDAWPLWVLHELAIALALHYAVRRAWPDPWRLHVGLAAVAAGTVTSVWALWSPGWWIVWPLLGLALSLAAHEPLRSLARRGALAVHGGVAAAALGVTGSVWLLTGGGAWIAWPVLGIATALAAHAVCREHVAQRAARRIHGEPCAPR